MLFLYIFLFVQIVYAVDVRRHHTATRLPNGTVYILGGIHATDKFASSALTLHISKDLSVHSTAYPTKPIARHSAHWHAPSQSFVSLFGLHRSDMLANQSGLGPPPARYDHTSVLLDEAIYVVGGRSSPSTEYNDIWKLISGTWSLAYKLDRAVAGHSTIPYRHWLISCFGATDGGRNMLRQCTWFDTTTLRHKSVIAAPPARIHACMTVLPGHNSSHVLLFGGRSNTTDLGDFWRLDLSHAPYQMSWQLIGHTLPRAGHADILLNDTLIMYYGGIANEIVYFDVQNMKWISPSPRQSLQARQITSPDGPIENEQQKRGLNGGQIGGIVVGVLALLALTTSFLVWNHRRRVQPNRHCSQSRFSLQPPAFPRGNNEPRLSIGSILMRQRSETEDSLIVRMPEPAKIQSRLSVVSFGSQFRVGHREEELKSSSQKTSVSDVQQQVRMDEPDTRNKEQSVEEQQLPAPEDLPKDPPKERRESTTLKRLTLNIFAARQQDESTAGSSGTSASPSSAKLSKRNTISTPTQETPSTSSPTNKRRSSLFRLLQLPMITANGSSKKLTRMSGTGSIGGKSVASIQWVEFNDAMDYKEQSWNYPTHLTVTNPRRSMTIASGRTSICTDGSSPASTPRSPSFPRQYHISESEALSWGDDLVHRINHHRQQQQQQQQQQHQDDEDRHSCGSENTFTLHDHAGRTPPDSQT